MQQERLTGGFWYDKQELVRRVTNDAVYRRFDETGRIHAFACGYPELDPVQPHFFWDSDVAKWIEGSAYLLMEKEDPELQAKIESIIDDIGQNQQPDGYFNIYFQTVEKENRFRNRDDHELYCAGHLMEAACAYYEATGRDRFLKMMCRYADLIEKVFVQEKSAAFRTPGHEEIELALVRLYRTTGEKRYLDLSRHFILTRGTDPAERELKEYFRYNTCQDRVPCRQRRTADGHAVRLLYLACGMADIAQEDGDEELKTACRAIFEDIWQSKHNVIGGFAARHWQGDGVGEAFPLLPYYLPNETAYNETCAAIAFVMFASRMLRWQPDGRMADLAERALYNNVLSGMSLSGDRFFYTNPTELHRALRLTANKTDGLPITQRVKVFQCSCCPPNLTRLFARLAPYAWHETEDCLWIHHYMSMDGERFAMTTGYPLDGTVRIENRTGKKLAVRIPGFVSRADADRPYVLRDGYAYFDRAETVTIQMHYAPRFLQCSTRVPENTGKAALQWGPFIYCAEGQDNGGDIWNLSVDTARPVRFSERTMDSVPLLQAGGTRRPPQAELYAPVSDEVFPAEITYIPYYCFANRGEDDMAVWMKRM